MSKVVTIRSAKVEVSGLMRSGGRLTGTAEAVKGGEGGSWAYSRESQTGRRSRSSRGGEALPRTGEAKSLLGGLTFFCSLGGVAASCATASLGGAAATSGLSTWTVGSSSGGRWWGRAELPEGRRHLGLRILGALWASPRGRHGRAIVHGRKSAAWQTLAGGDTVQVLKEIFEEEFNDISCPKEPGGPAGAVNADECVSEIPPSFRVSGGKEALASGARGSSSWTDVGGGRAFRPSLDWSRCPSPSRRSPGPGVPDRSPPPPLAPT